MKIGILAHESDEFESLSLAQTARVLGHSVNLFTLNDLMFHFNPRLNVELPGGTNASDLNLIISRGQIQNREDCDRYEMLAGLGVPLTDSPRAFFRSESKLMTMTELVRHELPVPRTRVCRTVEEIFSAVREFGVSVVKPSHGYGGRNVERFWAESFDIHLAENLCRRFSQLLVQEYLPHPEGDYRVTVAGGEVVFVARRVPNEQTWKANVTQGASIEVLQTAPSRVCELGIKAAAATGLFLAGVDILPMKNDYCVLEVNNCPGWGDLGTETLERVTKYIVNKALMEVRL